MNMSFKNIVRVIFISFLSVSALSSCSKWTETESVKYEYQTLEQVNPELYEAYLESLKEYRASEHPLLIAKFDNTAATPFGRAEHIASLPDSVDVVILKNIDQVNGSTLADKEEIMLKRATSTFGEISLPGIAASYKVFSDAWTGKEGESMPTFLEYVSDKVAFLLKKCDEVNVDGINVVYRGFARGYMNQADSLAQVNEQETFFTPIFKWLESNKDKKFFFQGSPQNIMISDFHEMDLILFDAEQCLNQRSFTDQIRQILIEKPDFIPADRFVPVVGTKNVVNPKVISGVFNELRPDGSSMTAIEGGARYVAAPHEHEGFTVKGLAVNEVQYDYFNPARIYPEVRRAISIMNPSPLK